MDIMDIVDIRDIMEVMEIMDIMDIMNILDIMDIMIITAWLAMAGAVSALVIWKVSFFSKKLHWVSLFKSFLPFKCMILKSNKIYKTQK